MPTPAIVKGSDHFFNLTYEGNGGGQKVGQFVPFTDNVTIAKSCIFDSASDVSLTRTPGSAGNRRTFTFSCWVKRGRLTDAAGNNTYGQRILNAGPSGSQFFDIKFSGSGDTEGADRLHIREYSSSAEQIEYWTNRRFEDTTKWYNFVVQVNTTDSTSGDRIKVYVDGDQITSWYRSNAPSLNFDTQVNATVLHNIGRFTGATSNNLDAYLAEVNLVDGSIVAPSTFGLTDTSTGRWIPKSLTGITYGTNGFRMEFANSAGQTIGDDTSGNGNDYAVSNIAVTDLTTDSPSQNFATGFHKQSDEGTTTRSEGALKAVQGGSTSKFGSMRSTLILDPNDPNLYYCEYKVDLEHGGNGSVVGFTDIRADGKKADSSDLRMDIGTNYMFACDTYVVTERDGGDAGTGNDSTLNPEFTTNDVMGLAFQAGKIWIAKNNTWSNSGNPAAGTGFLTELPKNSKYRFYAGQYGSSSGNAGTFNFGQKSFTYTPPTGAKNLTQDNLIDDGVKPDFVWIKNRDQSDNHALYDSSRGALNEWHINEDVPAAVNGGLQKFLQKGFTIEDDDAVNSVSESFVAWNWVAAGGTTAANTAGSGATVATTIQANQTAGFSICEFTGTGSNLRFAHGLSQAPEWIFIKRLEGSGAAQQVYHKDIGADKYVQLNEPDALVSTGAATTNYIEVPTSTYVDLGSNSNSNSSGDKSVAYCWHSVDGFSLFGSYTGNGNAEGPFIYTGFKPSWVMIKEYGNSNDWPIWDNARYPLNHTNNSYPLFANLSQGDNGSSIDMDVYSNGFKPRTNNSQINRSSGSYIFMAFAEHPFIGDGTNPATAR